MAEPIRDWWARRQFSRGTDIPYPIGTYREAWAPFPVLIRQYHPDLNAGIVLTQIPPAAEVLLQWQCDAGHIFVATPEEQRMRPGRERRRSSWCPECAAAARPRPVVGALAWPGMAEVPGAETRAPYEGLDEGMSPSAAASQTPVDPPAVSIGRRPAAAPEPLRSGTRASATTPSRPKARRRPQALCERTPDLPVGEPFRSECAPRPASAVEGELRAGLAERLSWTPDLNAIRLRRPFFDHLEAWPDIVLPELRIVVEYDSVGRHGLEHVGKREEADRRKDRAVRAARWEVVRIRTGRLEKLGPHDLQLTGLGRRSWDVILDEFREIRGPLLVDAYLR